jgi:hypothetical protein
MGEAMTPRTTLKETRNDFDSFRSISTFVAAIFMSGMLVSAATSFPLA